MDFNIDEAMMPDLYRAAKHIGLEYKLPIKKVALVELLNAALEENPSMMDGFEEDKTPPKPKAVKKVKIVIHESQDPNAINPVFVGLNGKSFVINRGQEVEVPEGVVGILENARETVFDKKFDDKGQMELIPRDALSYPYTIVT